MGSAIPWTRYIPAGRVTLLVAYPPRACIEGQAASGQCQDDVVTVAQEIAKAMSRVSRSDAIIADRGNKVLAVADPSPGSVHLVTEPNGTSLTVQVGSEIAEAFPGLVEPRDDAHPRLSIVMLSTENPNAIRPNLKHLESIAFSSRSAVLAVFASDNPSKCVQHQLVPILHGLNTATTILTIQRVAPNDDDLLMLSETGWYPIRGALVAVPIALTPTGLPSISYVVDKTFRWVDDFDDR